MAKTYNGGIKTPTSISVQKAEPSDDRMIVDTLSDLQTLPFVYPQIKIKVLSELGEDGLPIEYTWNGIAQDNLENWIPQLENEVQRAKAAEAALQAGVDATTSGLRYPIPQAGNTPTTEPAPTENGIYRVKTINATYTNFGGVVVPNDAGFIYDIQVSGLPSTPVYTLLSTDIGITIDAELNPSSTNAIQNQAVDAGFVARDLAIAVETNARELADTSLQENIEAEATARDLADINYDTYNDSKLNTLGVILESYTLTPLATGTSGSFFTKTYSLSNDIYISNIITHVTSKYLEYLNDADEILETVFGYGKTLTNRIIPKLTGATKVKLYSQSNTITVKVLEKLNSKIKKEADKFNKTAQILKEIGTELVPKSSDETVGSIYKFRFPYTFNTIINYAFVTSSSGIWIEVFNSSNVSIDQIRPEIGVSYVENYLLPNYPTSLDASYFKICIPAANYNNGITVSKAKLIVTENKLDKFTQEKLGTGVFKSTSVWGILGNGQGMLETEGKEAFKFFTANETDLYIKVLNYHATNPYSMNIHRVSDDSYFGTLGFINPLSTKYELYPIVKVASALVQTEIIGYASVKASAITRLFSDIFSCKPIFNIDTSIFDRLHKIYNEEINLWGDSMTAIGSGYGDYFRTNIRYFRGSVFGVGGETTKQIGGRMGTIPFLISADFTIPSTTTPVSINLKSSWDNSTCFPRADWGMNPCYINGVKGNLTVTSAGVSATFTRIDEGDALDVKIGTPLISNAVSKYKTYIHVVFVGQNGNYSSVDDNLEQWEAFTRPLKKYLVITPHLATSDELELKMSKKYGNLYFNLRHWCVNYALSEAGITPTTADLDAIALGNCPPSLLSDGTHFTETVQEIFAKNIIKRLVELSLIPNQ